VGRSLVVSNPSGDAPAEGRWDWQAIKEGASVAVVLAVPFTLIARFFFDSGARSGWAAILALGAFFGFLLGAGQAAWRQDRGTPLSHGLVTAAGTFLAVQAVFVVIKLIAGSQVHWGRIATSLVLTLGAGLIGGFCGSYLQRQGVHPRVRTGELGRGERRGELPPSNPWESER
jgi:hypothetical protein